MSKKTWAAIAIIALLMPVGIIVFKAVTRQGQANIVKIGAILPLTGDAAQYGKACRCGMDLAVKQLNAQGGVLGKTLCIIYEDSQAVPSTAVSAINKLIAVDGVKLIIGDMFSSPTLAIAPIGQ